MDDAPVAVRLACRRDALAIALLSRDQIEQGLGWKYEAATVTRLIAEPSTSSVVAVAGAGLAGFAIMQFAEETSHLLLMAVQPAHRRQGIARHLLQWLLDSARAAGVAEVGLELRAGNAVARAFYRHMGFTETGVVPGYYHQREAALRMRLRLRANLSSTWAWQPPTWDKR